MNKTITLTLDNARQMYNSGIEPLKQLALNNFTEDKLKEKPLPMSWEELQYIKGYHINTDSSIEQSTTAVLGTRGCNKNIFPTESLAKASLALAQLLQLRNRWNEGIDLQLSNGNTKKYSIYYANDFKTFNIFPTWGSNKIFIFKDKETTKLFLETFKDLLEEAKELI